MKNKPIISRKSSQTSENEKWYLLVTSREQHILEVIRGYTKINGNLDLKQPIKDKPSKLVLWRSMTGWQVLHLSWLICKNFSHCGCDKSRKRAAHNIANHCRWNEKTEAAGRNPQPLARAVTALSHVVFHKICFFFLTSHVCAEYWTFEGVCHFKSGFLVKSADDLF